MSGDLDAVESRAGPEDVGDGEGAVRLLVVLPEEDERAADRARGAVERVDEPSAAARVVAHTGLEPPGRVVAVVRARGELAVPLLRRQPDFEVVLLRRCSAEVAGRDVDDAVGEAEPPDDRLL